MTSIDERAEREQRYAEAVGLHSYHTAWPNARARVRAVMAVADAEQAELRAVNADYEHRISWDTTCKHCAGTYDLAVSQTFRAEAAEAKVARVEALAAEWGDWPITAQGQAADLLRDLRAALAGDADSTSHTIAAANLVRAHLMRTVAFTWENGARYEAPLLGFTRNEFASPEFAADAALPVQLLIDTGHAFGPQWFDVDESCELTFRVESVA